MNKLCINKISDIAREIFQRISEQGNLTNSKKSEIIEIIKESIVQSIIETDPHFIDLKDDKIIELYNNILH
tara:strand:- start:252 stop:464 length:213 start_codon:yes stop_codon:yes gene_type:complete